MDSPFSFSEAPTQYFDFLQEKRRQMIGVVVGAVAFGAFAGVALAAFRGDPSEAIPAVVAMGQLFAITAVGLGAYGLSQGGMERDL